MSFFIDFFLHCSISSSTFSIIVCSSSSSWTYSSMKSSLMDALEEGEYSFSPSYSLSGYRNNVETLLNSSDEKYIEDSDASDETATEWTTS